MPAALIPNSASVAGAGIFIVGGVASFSK